MLQRLEEHLVVGICAVGGRVAVPRGDVNPELHPTPLASDGKLAQHIAFAIAPRAFAHSVRAHGIGPQTEAVVMLGRKDNSLKASLLRHIHPLVAIESGGIEDILRLRTLTPLQPREGVGAEMAEHVHLHPLPRHLCGRRNGSERFRRIGRLHFRGILLRLHGKTEQNEKQEQGRLLFHIFFAKIGNNT